MDTERPAETHAPNEGPRELAPPVLLPRGHTAVRRWLALVCWYILAMIVLGGVTRLTQSGLSMVTWEPIMGVIPPRTEADWQHRFDQYRQFPEYQKLNRGMTLDEFKGIFLWEYTHRLVGRLLGAVYLLPYLWFLFRGRLRGALGWKLGGALLLGGLQGALGWYMVKSGLVDNPRVSHLRLAAHFGLALLLLGWLFWIHQGLLAERHRIAGPRPLRKAAWAFLVLLAVQMEYGAFVAGLDAGVVCNTFPTMFGYWIPPQAFDFTGQGLDDVVNNPLTVQFLHRALALVVGLAAWGLWWWGRNYGLTDRQRRYLRLLPALTALQIVLGVITLLRFVPVGLATAHQLNGVLLLLAAVGLLQALAAPRAALTPRPATGTGSPPAAPAAAAG